MAPPVFLFSTSVCSAILRGGSLGNTVSPESLFLGNLDHSLAMVVEVKWAIKASTAHVLDSPLRKQHWVRLIPAVLESRRQEGSWWPGWKETPSGLTAAPSAPDSHAAEAQLPPSSSLILGLSSEPLLLCEVFRRGHWLLSLYSRSLVPSNQKEKRLTLQTSFFLFIPAFYSTCLHTYTPHPWPVA